MAVSLMIVPGKKNRLSYSQMGASRQTDDPTDSFPDHNDFPFQLRCGCLHLVCSRRRSLGRVWPEMSDALQIEIPNRSTRRTRAGRIGNYSLSQQQ
jgi:hypothetical protein